MIILAVMTALHDGIKHALGRLDPIAYRLFEPPRKRALQSDGTLLHPLS